MTVTAFQQGSPLFHATYPGGLLPLVGGKVYTYAKGTSTPKATWADANQGATNPNPVVLDAYGDAKIFISGEYKFVVRDALGILIYTMDGISSPGGNVSAIGNAIITAASAADVRALLTVPTFVATRTAMKALDGNKDPVVYLREAGREDFFDWDATDLSRSFVTTSVDSGADTATKTDHGLMTGQAFTPGTSVNGLTAGTLYYAIRLTANTFAFAISRLDANASANINITGTTNFTVYMVDDQEGLYVVPSGKSINRVQGAYKRRTLTAREYEARWWGAIAGAADNAIPINCGIFEMARPGSILLPPGILAVASQIRMKSNARIRGVGKDFQTYLSATAAFGGVFGSSYAIDSFQLEDLTINGQSLAGSGIACENLTHSAVRRLTIAGTTIAGIRWNNGYNVDIEENEIFTNLLDGISVSGVNNNNVNIIRNKVYANGGIGIQAADGYGINLEGNTIEGNDIAGIMMWDVRTGTIRNNYFERNAKTGFGYTTASGSPENVTIKADIHLNSLGRIISADAATCVDGVIIDGNVFSPYGTGNFPTPGLKQDVFVFTSSSRNVAIRNNAVSDTAHVDAMVGLYDDNAYAQLTGELIVDGNTINTFKMLGTKNGARALATAHVIDVPCNLGPHNYASQDIFDYAVLSGASGTLIKHSANYEGYPIYALTAGDRLYGYDVDPSTNLEMRSQMLWFGCWYHITDTGSGLSLYLGGHQDGGATETAYANGEFRFKSVALEMGSGATSAFIALQRTGSGANPVLICNPVLSLVGFGAGRHPIPARPPLWKSDSTPAAGTWAVGDAIKARAPAAGSPAGRVCTVAGAPGTWKVEANLA